jgi:hypothetical protein
MLPCVEQEDCICPRRTERAAGDINVTRRLHGLPDENNNTQADSVNISLERIADALTAIADHLTRTMVRQ